MNDILVRKRFNLEHPIYSTCNDCTHLHSVCIDVFLFQVKELGAVIYNCSCLAKDLYKIFQSYWDLGYRNATVPQPWPEQYSTSFNKDNPLLLNINGAPARVYISVRDFLFLQSLNKSGSQVAPIPSNCLFKV